MFLWIKITYLSEKILDAFFSAFAAVAAVVTSYTGKSMTFYSMKQETEKLHSDGH